MTQPLAGGSFEPVTVETPLRGRKARIRANPSLTLGRTMRAIGRQFSLFIIVLLIVGGAGAIYDFAGGMPLAAVFKLWGPVGLAAGFGAGMIRELGRNTIGSLTALGRHRGYALIGAAPELSDKVLRELPPDKRTPLGALAFQPSGAFATSFRDIQSALGDRVVAFIGSVPNEGATTAALCAAASATQQGRRVIVVDCDIRRRSLTRLLHGDTDFGVLEAADEPGRWVEALCEEDEIGVAYIAAAKLRNPWRNLSSAKGFRTLVQELRARYDLVILDCPPALSNADGAMVARVADRIVVVAAWDETPLAAVRNTMRTLKRTASDATTLFINRVPAGYRFARLRGD
ncbi:CpsD/CapB family tyrosine-protein kinase [Terricaulis sp.]|uniref:CpsD/CapB family tyrosine-protein kinase n=1 Tax=Terricaulis sp. TaxID=2768686 RepID=UPI003783F417